jgi:hypothetical protein
LHQGTNLFKGTGSGLRVGVRHAELPFPFKAESCRLDVHFNAAAAIGFDQCLNLLLRLARGGWDTASPR